MKWRVLRKRGPDLYARILRGEQHALAVDHILDALPVTTGTRARCSEPELWAGQRLGAQVLGKAQIRNAKEQFGRSFLSINVVEGRGQSKQMEKTTLLLPPTSTGFYPDGNSPGKHHGKQRKTEPRFMSVL